MADKKFTLLAVLKSDVAKFQSGMSNANKSLGKFSKGAQSSGISMRKMAIGAGIVIGAIAGITAAATSFAKAADVQIQAETKVATAIKSTSQAAGFLTNDLKKIASGLQEMTTFGDEEILSGVTANLLTFTNIAGNEFKDAQKIILDMSTLLGTDLKSQSIQVGKALNYPIQGISALSKVGVSFTQHQKDVIKQLVETGNKAEAQRVILAELNKEFGGQAAAAAKQGMGGWKQISNTFGDIKEQLGFAVMPLFQKLGTWLKDFIPKAVNGFNAFANKIIHVYNEFVDLYNKSESFRKVIEGIKAAVKGYMLGLQTFFNYIGETFTLLKDVIKAIFDPDLNVKDAWNKYKESLNELGNNFIDEGKKIGEDFTNAVQNGMMKKSELKSNFGFLDSGVGANETRIAQSAKVDNLNIDEEIDLDPIEIEVSPPDLQPVINQFKALGTEITAVDTMTNFASTAVDGLTGAFGDLFNNTIGGFKSVVTSMLEGLSQIINGLLAQAIAGMIAGESTKGLVGLATGALGVGLLLGLWKSKVPAFSGGMGYLDKPTTLIAGDAPEPEMILRQSQLQNIVGAYGGMSGNVVFRIEGTQLVGVLAETNKKTKHIR